MSEANPTTLLRSVGAIFAGMVTVVVLSLGTDVILHATHRQRNDNDLRRVSDA